MKYRKRHIWSWSFFRPLVKLVLKIKFNFSAPFNKIEGPCLLMCNHVTDWDPLFINAAFKQQMYFVTSEHLLRLGFVSKIIEFLQSPIARQKGGSAASTVKAIIRTVRDGRSVAFFPEGNRTWDGLTHDFPEATGKLVKSCAATLITYRLHGGYFSNPRWAGAKIRRGKMRGELIGVYSPEELKGMSGAEVNALIARDIFEDAYALQAEENIAYKGRNIAEHLETMLFICPKCGALHVMKSEGDRFYCTACGASARYTATGFIESEDFSYTTLTEWNNWQTERIHALCDEAGDSAVFEDSGWLLRRVHSGKSVERIAEGEVRLFRDRLELPGGISLPIGFISGMSLRGPVVLYIGTGDGDHYELRGCETSNVLKYLTACAYLGSPVGVGV